jgi:glutathione S-transferase
MAYTLLGSGISPYVRKVKLVLLEKQIAHTVEDVVPFNPPAGWRAISPLGKIPVLRHDDKIVNDSTVICEYLERLHPTPPLHPDDPYALACARWIEEYVDGGVIPVTGPRVFFELVVKPLLGQKTDEVAAKKVVDEELPAYFDYLEAELEGDYYVGDRLSIADIAVGNLFVSLRLCGVKPEASRWKKLSAFVDRMHARASFKAVIEPLIPAVGKRWV